MRGKRAKFLRKQVYGDMALRTEEVRKQESILSKIVRLFKTDSKGREAKEKRYTIRNTGLRRVYQNAKKIWKRRVA